MRKRIKKQVLESMDYLLRTAGSLEKLLKGISRETAIDVLGQVQDLVIQIGNTIEESEGTEHEIIHKLEQICEVLYQVSCSLEKQDDRKNLLRELETLILDARKDMEENIPAKIEIVFIPYQVTMWDSLESVWLAAREEPDVDCYVVPCPFYDVLPDNTLGELHYEGERYPDYVPVTPYWEYFVEDRCPDVIFFHNPYDDLNLITRVPERFYAKNMKQYTEMLVYIPYFVSAEGEPSDHQCYTNGVLYADRAVVQPGSVYEKYCRIYSQVLKENNAENVLVPAEQKFLPLGSPKFDKLLNMRCGIEDLPEQWQKMILRPDGSRKKIIFYNVSIIPLLNYGEQILKKLDYVFAFFKEKREEAVLLWRPHPLLMNTIDSMRPQLKEAYMERLRIFKDEGWGIYDETPDSNLSMAVSDAYYGDFSSLVTSYRETGKPILVQSAEIPESEKIPENIRPMEWESVCSLQYWYDSVPLSDGNAEKQSDAGKRILQEILKQVKE